MTKAEIKKMMKEAMEEIEIANVYFRFHRTYSNLIPIALNDKLFIAIEEDDFIFDGYSIYRFKDVTKLKIKKDKCDEILKKEGLTSNITIPNIDISNWKTVFESLKSINKNIIVEKQTIDNKNSEFIIGRIENIYKNFAYVWNFDADGIWDDSPTKIPYSEITNITFASRYVNVFSKYISEPPFIKRTDLI